jgi:hypothetical protein
VRSWELQEAIYTKLSGWAALSALAAGGIHDHVPQDVEFPYVVIGDNIATPADTDTTQNSDDVVIIHTWSRYRGKKEAKQIQQAIYDALHQKVLSVSNAVFIDCNLTFQEIFLDDDGLTRHGVQRFLFFVDEVTA